MTNTKDYRSSSKITLSTKQKKYIKDFKNTIKEVTKLMDSFKFYYAGEKIYHYFWHVFCDKIIEESKVGLASSKERMANQYMLLEILLTSLKLLHPFMPFITEEIYQKLPIKNKKECIMIENWPS